MILFETYLEFLTDLLDNLYSEGPPVIKLVSVNSEIVAAYVNPDYGNYLLYPPTDKVLGQTTTSSYSIDEDGRVEFLDMPDFIGLDMGMGQLFEVWNASETECYFRLLTDTPREIVGNNDIIRVVLRMPYGGPFNDLDTVAYQLAQSYYQPVIDEAPRHFPMQFRIKFPDYILNTNFHKVSELSLRAINVSGGTIASHQVYGSGESGAIFGARKGWRDAWKLPAIPDPSIYNPLEDWLLFDYVFSDNLNAILTLNCVRSDTLLDKFQIIIENKFYSTTSGYAAAPAVGSIDASIFSPRDLIVERKRFGETTFTPITVTTTDSAVTTNQGRYDRITATWTWEV